MTSRIVSICLAGHRMGPRCAAVAVWLVATLAGMLMLISYSNAPGDPDVVPFEWPRESTIVRDDDCPTLLVFLHPRCPCSRATVNQLAKTLASNDRKIDLRGVFYCPENEPETWAHTDLWHQMAKLSRKSPVIDRNGCEAAKFGATTSGHALLYASTGRRLYSGGITTGRGHEGDNLGSETLKKVLRGEQVAQADFPVYGCAIATARRQGE